MSGNSIKLRAEIGDRNTASVRLLVNHPMLSERLDARTGKIVPPHHIEEIVIALNGETVLVIDCGPGVAANPFFSFDIAGARRGDVLTVIWRDNQQQSDRFQAAVL
jgi:sulfur-oxidizing protein SoxZ